ncbi:hypothetical protein N0O92_07735 [Alkalihalobacillus sp. MEB130]|uniref:CBO0543 family protein n=1 Tax=Alkalihalobacillus sp. MEB130 TaxID=2976704 RepID=UPI0028DD6448|nr:CBO0543 family protein [Alkalihalobacillus sp. MEB130]MDT8860121.1 hypothetical protein [Alkalihalobacillus sp. MEB130]
MSEKKRETAITVSACLITTLLLILFVPKKRIREAHVAFLFQQVITWFFGLLVVEKGFIKYPFRMFFKKAVKSSFVFEYYIFPAFTALYNIHYPEKKPFFLKVLYTASFSGLIATLEKMVEKKTSLISYKKWNPVVSFLTMSMAYYVSRLYVRWFLS